MTLGELLRLSVLVLTIGIIVGFCVDQHTGDGKALRYYDNGGLIDGVGYAKERGEE